jgi:hypothetical protein
MSRSNSLARVLLIFAALLTVSGAGAQELKIFDAHLHYNQEPDPFYPLAKVLELFKSNGVAGIVANSRPNKGTHQLVEAKAPGLWVVPFIRPYRVRSDIQTWFNDPAIFQLIQDEYKRGYYKGVGEFHIYGKDAEAPVVRQAVNFAVERDLYILAHCDEEALLTLFRHNGRAKIIWAHTGFSVPLTRVRELLDTYPALMAELSYRSGIEGGGPLSEEWRRLFSTHSGRFLLGSDTWIGQRWAGYGTIMRSYRSWLAELPADQARRIAYGNAERLFGGKIE